MREYPLEGSYDLGVALSGTFPDINRFSLYVWLSYTLRHTSLYSGVGLGGVEDIERRKDIEER